MSKLTNKQVDVLNVLSNLPIVYCNSMGIYNSWFDYSDSACERPTISGVVDVLSQLVRKGLIYTTTIDGNLVYVMTNAAHDAVYQVRD